jgi:hypothetical protein
MLIAAAYLVDRLRHPRSRADEVRELRRALAQEPTPSASSAEEIELAHRARALKIALSRAAEGIVTCSSCAKGHPLPHGRWNGGHCCGARTEELFTGDELAMLKLAGTGPLDLVAPHAEHAGCAFRGPEGCSLDPAHRPALCVRYVCRDLERELTEQGRLGAIDVLAAELSEVSARFARLRAARLATAELGPLAELERELME